MGDNELGWADSREEGTELSTGEMEPRQGYIAR